MKITLKTVGGANHVMECEAEIKIGDLKQKIQDTHNLQAVGGKLVSLGKVLEDNEKTLEAYGVKDGGSVIVMPSKARPQKAEEKKADAPKPVVDINASAAAQSQAAQATATQAQPAQTQSQQVQAPAQAQPAPAQTNATALPPGVSDSNIADLMSITGKQRELCVQALVLAQGNMEMAASVIFEGLTAQQMQAMASQGVGADDGDDGGDAPMYGGAGGMGGGAGGNPLAELAQNPHFAVIMQRIREDPNFYQEFMTKLAQDNPQLFALIQADPMSFMNMVLAGNPNAIPTMPQGAGAGGMGGGMPGMGGAQRAGPPRIQVTQQELDAITRLESLGFQKQQCLEALRAFGGNEEQAANFLFETGMEDENAAFLNAVQASSQPAQAQPSQAQPADAQPPSGDASGAQQQPAADDNADGNEQQQQQPGASDGAGDAQQNPDNNNNDGGDGGANDGGDQSAFD